MNKKVEKILNILVIAIVLITITTTVFADDATSITPSTLKGTPSTAATNVGDVANKIIGILQTVGIVLSVIVLIIIGIKYMMGSAEEKAEYKKTLLPYVIGAALIFAASVFAQAVYDFFVGMNPQG